MDVSISGAPVGSTVENAVRAFLDAPAASVPDVFRQLAAAFRCPAGEASEEASDPASAFAVHVAPATATAEGRAAVPVLASALREGAPADRTPHLVVLLALLADTGAHDAVRAESPAVLSLFDGAAADRRLTAALLYFAGFFPADRERVLKAADALRLSADDRSRLLRSLDGERTERHALGREWPSPAMWAVTEAELEADRRNWISAMPASDLDALWTGDTRKIRDYSALKALALLDTPVRPYRGEPDHAEPGHADPEPGAHAADAGSAVDLLAPAAALLACPDCHGSLTLTAEAARCDSCGREHPATADWLDLSSDAGGTLEAMIINDPGKAARYERGLRPAFLRAMGRDFEGLLTVDQEIAFLRRHLGPVTGPVLDLAAGTGRFTRVVAETAPGPVIALDLATSMLTALQATPPKLPAVRGSALSLPFADASLGAVTCWNALQTLPGQEQVIHEVSRCLADGGTFALFTFEQSADPLYREFQARHEKDLLVELQSRETLVRWLAEAKFTVREAHRTGCSVLLAAIRDPR